MSLPATPPLRIGLDLGGTKIEAIVMGPRGEILRRVRRSTPGHDYAAILGRVGDLVRELEAGGAGPLPVGIGLPGAISSVTGGIKNANTVSLNGRPFLEDIEALLARPVRLANDADCFALSEARDGAGAGAGSVFGVIIGTGTGGGIVINGELLRGANAITGEWGHNPLPWATPADAPAPPCYCGHDGCIETYLSGPGFSRDFREQTGLSLSPAEIVAAAQGGDEDAGKALERYLQRLSRALASVINILDPEVIVLGGGMSNIDAIYRRVPQMWRDHVFSDRVDTRLRRPRYGDSSGVRGAAWLCDGALGMKL